MPEPNERESDEGKQLALVRQMVDLSIEQTRLAEQRNVMSAQRSEMSADRSEMSAERSYMNAERTLSVWIRTALATMVVGLAIDRFGLLLHENLGQPAGRDTASTSVGAALVALGVLIAVVTGVRFRLYAAVYCRAHTLPHHHGPFMAPAFALLVALFGIAILVLLITAPDYLPRR